ncbi:50S ribosomal protein L11 methyltransferase [Candidatus Ulvibacter alkanivorans]|uniref:50S ribosomal protein L11 methyltransferase n=1 Tax=Candidatus Ulvibacter alkanivorans TaxID=2267620 RepID=UPI000DF41762|nr:50S ribosomal protein L11 methyltransferase [Candidatus Ulvibacter alkanivorans]
MVYIEYKFRVAPLQPGTEILIAELGAAGFESFVETEDGVLAYIQKEEWNESILAEVRILASEEFSIDYERSEIAQENWNSNWEQNFHPIEVAENCRVRAPFHDSKEMDYEIVIEPKMSFGTGHHETTYMMLSYVLENEFDGLTVLDMGCGTAVLAILASMRGAKYVDAIDIDRWCYENSIENAERNNCKNISVLLGDASLLQDKKYDLIIANINRNILLNDIETYRASLNKNGQLYLSGFYKEDLPIIESTCNKFGLRFVDNKEKNRWIAAKFVF